ncbi:Clavaminate synthase-like protein [Microstroma glucosiphilum]|uniref:Clavaminate synthase-like protein n=1 Tax=Pseudomicrostroma glucosiphilum TaxID=1684307 RepID=A0A316UCX2_9BASI|nr:Clavaminate synthase-like protein [Pseudomicrostroma glucosiphilum]PWN23087.1 Clavaminate synthase-like protein [Pseudomicrostroma glucosiphilum]
MMGLGARMACPGMLKGSGLAVSNIARRDTRWGPSHSPTLSAFSSHLHSEARQSEPHAWPALEQWRGQDASGKETLQGLRRVRGLEDHPVEVEVGKRGRGYLDGEAGGWQKVRMPFGIFLEAFILRSIPSADPDLIGYVAQQDLLADLPELAEACPVLPHTSSGPRGDREQWRRNVWIGPEGTFTPIHRDPYENLFVQVIGTKRVHLFPPSYGPNLYLSPSTTSQSNTSTIPTEDYLLESSDSDTAAQRASHFPLLNEAMACQGAAHTILGPGDALYIPQGWFHCIKSLETSVSVNSWWR